jgi:hypothetical protein
MKNKEIYELWEQVEEDYADLFFNSNGLWKIMLDKYKTFVQENERHPMRFSIDMIENRLAIWYNETVKNYKKKVLVMSNPENRTLWKQFQEECNYMNEYSTLTSSATL